MRKTLQTALVIFLFAITDARRVAMAADPAAGCGQFVQKFYDWYVAREKALNKANSRKDVMEVAMKEKRSSFSPELLAALQEDVAAAHKDPGEIVGLDFDPILNTQEDPGRYVVGEVHSKGDLGANVAYLVDVFVVRDGKKGAKPWIMPELVSKNGQWMFTNFHYEKENLVSVLQQLKKDREQTKGKN